MTPARNPSRCPVCAGESAVAADLVVLSRLDRSLWRCSSCGHLYFPSPDWLEEAYRSSIAVTDVGLVERSLRLANVATSFLLRYPDEGRVLDFAAGTGLLVRLLRDRGFDARYYDEYGPNYLAKGFEVEAKEPERYRLIIAVEVAEHLVDPLAVFDRLASLSDSIIVTTKLAPAQAAPPLDWEYFSLATGQHVSFFTSASLRAVAGRLGLNVVSRGDMHLLSKRRVSPTTWRLITTNTLGQLLALACRSRSLAGVDLACALDELSSGHVVVDETTD